MKFLSKFNISWERQSQPPIFPRVIVSPDKHKRVINFWKKKKRLTEIDMFQDKVINFNQKQHVKLPTSRQELQ